MHERPEAIRYELAVRQLEVERVTRLSTSLVRVELGGSDLDGFRTNSPTDHVKLIPPGTGETRVDLPTGADGRTAFPDQRPVMRDYTVRRYDPTERILTLDLVEHGDGAVGSWAGRAEPSHVVGVAGPRGSRPVPISSGYLLVGDLSSLPAISRWLEELPAGATGRALVAIGDDGDRVETEASEMIDWVTGQGTPGDALAPALADMDAPPSDTFVWAAGEVEAMRSVRDQLRDVWGLEPAQWKVDGYWRRGRSDYDHHAALDDD